MKQQPKSAESPKGRKISVLGIVNTYDKNGDRTDSQITDSSSSPQPKK